MKKLLKIFNLYWEDNLIAFSGIISFLRPIWIVPCIYFFITLKLRFLLIFGIICAYTFLYPIITAPFILIAAGIGLFANVFVYAATSLLAYDIALIYLAPPDYSTLGFIMALLAAYYTATLTLQRCFVLVHQPVRILFPIPFFWLSIFLFLFPFSLYSLHHINIFILFFVQFVYVYALSYHLIASYMKDFLKDKP